MDEQHIDSYPLYPWVRPVAWVTWTLVGTTIAVFLLQLAVYHFEGADLVGDALAFSPGAFAEHHYWTILTYAWAHAVDMFGHPDLFWLHIVANMIPLICFGPALEEYFSHGWYLVLYLGGAVAAAMVWFLFNQDAGLNNGIIGASGAIFALIAAAGTVAPRARIVAYLFFVLPIPMRLGVLAAVACGFEALQIIFGWLPEVAHSAHLGGAAFGFLFVLAFRWSRRNRLSH